MYGGGWINKKVIIINTTYGEIEGCVGPANTPKHLIDKIGVVIDAYDDRYDAEYPTGYERITLIVREENGNEFEIDAGCVREIK